MNNVTIIVTRRLNVTDLQEIVMEDVNQDGRGSLVMMVDIYNLEDHIYYPHIQLNRESTITLLTGILLLIILFDIS